MKMNALLLLLLMLTLSSCASPRTARIPDTMAIKKPLPSPGLEQTGERAAATDAWAGVDTKLTYSLMVKNAELKDALLLLARKTGHPIIVDSDVSGRVTAELKDRSIKDILFVLLKPFGFNVLIENGIIRVSRPRLVTKTFFLNYLKDKRSSSSTMNASVSENQNSTSSSSSTTSSLSTSSSSPSSSSSRGVTVSSSGTSDYWSEIIKGLEVIVFGDSTHSRGAEGGYSKGDKSGKQLVVNELAGIVYIKDYPDNLENVKAFLDDVDRSLKRQVLIQAHIAEVTLTDSYSFGINWSNVLSSGIGKDLQPTTISQGLAISPTGVFQVSVTNDKITALLDAMKEQGSLNMLSSPKISTLNNQKAVIKLTTKEVSWYQKTTYTNSTPAIVITDNEPQIDEVGIYLDVTPQINEQGTITMQIHPNISEKTKMSVSPDGKSSRPVIDIREVDTMIEAKNNQTIVIAGLIVDKIVETKRGVPILCDIPYLGALFSYVSQDKKKTELVILITPYVLNDKTVAEIRAEHEERIKDAERKFSVTP